jgi:hypothetical protein
VELAPPLLPAGLDQLRFDRDKCLADARLALRVRVRDERAVALLEALRMEFEQSRTCFLERVGRDRDRDSAELPGAQRNALFSLSKNP